MQRKIKLAKRTNTKPDPIDDVFESIPVINKQRLEAGLEPIISLAVGEPHLPVNAEIKEALKLFLDEAPDGRFPYSTSRGNEQVLEAIANLYNHYYPSVSSPYSTDEVMLTNGATGGVWNALSILVDEGEDVVVFEPYYSAYRSQIEMLGGNLVSVETAETNFKPTAANLAKVLADHPKTKAIIFNYPNNPTGVDLNRQELEALVRVLQAHPNVAIIVDDVYRELAAGEHLSIFDIDPSLKDRAIIVNSGSKGLVGGPGFRVGTVGAIKEWIDEMAKIQSANSTSVVSLCEEAARVAIHAKLTCSAGYQKWLKESKEVYKTNTDYVLSQLPTFGWNAIQGGNGFFLLADASSLIGSEIPKSIIIESPEGKRYTIDDLQQKLGTTTFRNDKDIAAYLMHAAGVAVIPGSGFGIKETSGHLRFSCAKAMPQLEKAMSYISQSVSACKLAAQPVKASEKGFFAPEVIVPATAVTSPSMQVRPN